MSSVPLRTEPSVKFSLSLSAWRTSMLWRPSVCSRMTLFMDSAA